MKNMFKRNQIMITALAIMIAVAGYLNFAGTKIGEEEMVNAGAQNAQEDMSALLDLSDEDLSYDIPSLDSDTEGMLVDNYLDADMQVADQANVSVVSDFVDEGMAEDAEDTDFVSQDVEVQDGETPGEAVYTSSSAVPS